MLDSASMLAPKAVPTKLLPIDVMSYSPWLEGKTLRPPANTSTQRSFRRNPDSAKREGARQQPRQMPLIFESILDFSCWISASIRALSLGSTLAPTVPPFVSEELAAPKLLVPGGGICARSDAMPIVVRKPVEEAPLPGLPLG